MKYLKFIIPIVVLGAAIGLGVYQFLNCEDCKPKTTLHSYLIDYSDSELVNLPDLESVIESLNLTGNIFDGSIFRLRKISSVNYAEEHRLALQQTQALLEVENQRWAEVRKYFEDIQVLLEDFKGQPTGTTHSLILQPLSQELKAVRQEQVDQTTLYVYSDLKEHHPDGSFSLYDESTKQILLSDPEPLKKLIVDYVTWPNNLGGIHIVFVYQSKEFTDIRIFEAMATILKETLESRGAQVSIHSTLNL